MDPLTKQTLSLATFIIIFVLHIQQKLIVQLDLISVISSEITVCSPPPPGHR